MTTQVAIIVELERKVLVLPRCESQMIGCCVCPAHFPVHQSHTRRDCRQTSGSSCQIASSSSHLPPPHPRCPHLHSRHSGRDLRSISGRGLGYSITPLDLNKEKMFTWIAAPAATPPRPPPPPSSSAPPVCWRTVCYVLESQIQPPWSSALFECEHLLSWMSVFTSDFSGCSSVFESLELESEKKKKKSREDKKRIWYGLRGTLDFWRTARDVLTLVLHSHQVLHDRRKQKSET